MRAIIHTQLLYTLDKQGPGEFRENLNTSGNDCSGVCRITWSVLTIGFSKLLKATNNFCNFSTRDTKVLSVPVAWFCRPL